MQPIFLTLMLLAAPIIADRVVVSVGAEAITLSEVREEIAVTAFLNGEKPDYSAGVTRRAAERLVDQALIRKEMDVGRYPLPEPSVAEAMMTELVKSRGGEAAFDKELAAQGLTRAELREHLQFQAALVRFVEVRFRPAVQVTDEDVQKYFRQHYATKTEQGKPVSLESLKDQILEQLTAERADEQMEDWLKETRKQVQVNFRDDAFAAELKK